jgi:aquaporin Z
MTAAVRILIAETVGTAVLVLGGCGTAVLATGKLGGGSVGVIGVAFAFGLSLLVMAYAIGNLSGCHINPAVTTGLWALGKVRHGLLPFYFIGQLAGGAIGGLAVYGIASGRPDGFSPDVKNFAVNGWGPLSPAGFNFSAMAIVEVVLTAVLVFVVASTTHRKFSTAAGGLAVGFTLTLIHLISIPVDNTSVNPARSFGVAIFAGGRAMSDLWAFFVFPLIGGVIGAALWKVIDDGTQAEEPLADVADS